MGEVVPSMHHSPSGLTHASWLYLLLAKEPKSHRRRSLEIGRHQRHHSKDEEEALEMAWPCTSLEEGPPSIYSTDMSTTWKEGQRQTTGYLEMDN